MNLDICKKCLSNDKLPVAFYCSVTQDSGKPKAFLLSVTICRIAGILASPVCSFRCEALLDVKFLEYEIGRRFDMKMFALDPEKEDEFFNLITEVHDLDCPYFLEHELYDWSVEK